MANLRRRELARAMERGRTDQTADWAASGIQGGLEAAAGHPRHPSLQLATQQFIRRPLSPATARAYSGRTWWRPYMATHGAYASSRHARVD
jgi:hypothetical protein